MRQPSRRWRDDRLGGAVSRGLARYRDEEPSDGVWRRIAAEVEGSRRSRAKDFSLSRATVLSVVLLVGMAMTSLGVQFQTDLPAVGDPTAYGELTPEEQAVASRAAAPGPWNLSLPQEPLSLYKSLYQLAPPREAYNRDMWLSDAEGHAGGVVQPLSPVIGQ